jgi:hypothetical protein
MNRVAMPGSRLRPGPAGRRVMRRAALTLFAAVLAAAAFAGTAAAQAPVPCTGIGDGKYNCEFYPAGDGISGGAPVLNPAGSVIGYLHQGTNWVICQQAGRTERSGAYFNKWWAFTQADNGKWGWVNAVYAKGGDNDGQWGGGVPNCNDGKGNPPGGGATPPPTPPPPPPPAGQPTTCGSEPGPGDAVRRWAPVVRCVLGMLGQPQSDSMVDAVFIIIWNESRGNPNAINLWDSNAKKGQPSQGLMQVIPATFSWRRSPNLPNQIKDPAANIYAGLNWGIWKYGSIANIPGVKSVRSGGGYKPYATAQARGVPRSTNCKRVRSGRMTLSVDGRGQRCAQARKAAARLDRQPAIRSASRPAADLTLKAGSSQYTCAVDPARHGRAVRAVSCQSGKRTLWWTASKRRH